MLGNMKSIGIADGQFIFSKRNNKFDSKVKMASSYKEVKQNLYPEIDLLTNIHSWCKSFKIQQREKNHSLFNFYKVKFTLDFFSFYKVTTTIGAS